MALTVEDFCTLLVRSRLYTPAQVAAFRQRWQAVALRASNLDDFSAWLVARHGLTEYQSDLVKTGHTDNLILGTNRILERIGKGRTAGVYKATDGLGRTVALKVLPPSRARDPEVLARFQREAKLAVQLGHPGVVKTFEYGEANGLHFIVMEYLDGETLDELLATRKRLRPREAARIGLLAARGLQHLHERGMIHRDFKPANLMLTPAPLILESTWASIVKILDIGLGRLLHNPDSPDGGGELTSDGATLGTPDYMAPEQARDPRRADARADLYGLGCILYHTLAGVPPFPDTNFLRQILRHASEIPRPLTELVRDVPEPLSRVVETLLAKDPKDRFQTASQVAEALQPLIR